MKTGDAEHRRKKHRVTEAPPTSAAGEVPQAGYVSLCSRPGGGESKPIFFASNPMGGALLSTGITGVAASAVASIASFLPVGLSGLEVHETLHRFDANAHLPTLERGVSGANRMGEPIGTLTMRWRLAPDGFEATPEAAPPDTEIRNGRSQRFVMQDGAITFQERGHGALRFFGAGRTYPATTDGQARLLFAGTAVIVEGSGSLKGVRGTLMLSGEIMPPSAMALNVVGRFEAGGPVHVQDALGPLVDLIGDGTAATVLTLVGESDEGGVERIRVARVGNDLANASRLRSFFRAGQRIGTVRGPLPFDPADVRCSVPLAGASRILSFADQAGRQIGTITADGLEGTAAPEVRDSRTVNRVVAYGAASRGTGALAGAGGVLTFESAVEPSGHTTTLYALRLSDPAGRFRASYSDAHPAVPPMAADGPPPPAPVETLHFVENGESMTEADRALLRYAERTMADGVELARWWEDKERVGDYAERVDVVHEFDAGNHNFSFFDTAVVNNAALPVMGMVQEMFYDRPKTAKGDLIRDQLKEFVLHYFMRVSHLRYPDIVPEGGPATRWSIEKMVSWLPDESERQVGMGYQQLYYKLHESGKIGKFAKEQRPAIVDLREIGEVYDWILLKVDLFDFNVSFAPFGAEAPKLQMPLMESTYLMLGPPFVKNEDNPEPGVLGRYGFTYAFVPCAPPAPSEGPGAAAYRPGHFAAAIQTVDFTLRQDGEIRVLSAFVVSRPNKVTNVDIAPVDWGLQLADKLTFGVASRLMSPVKAVADRLPLRVNDIDPVAAYIWMANTMTGGLAARRLGISKSTLEKRVLVQHFTQHFEMLNSSLLAWRLVPDWTDRERLPAFCHEGVAC